MTMMSSQLPLRLQYTYYHFKYYQHHYYSLQCYYILQGGGWHANAGGVDGFATRPLPLLAIAQRRERTEVLYWADQYNLCIIHRRALGQARYLDFVSCHPDSVLQ
jgi:hypothetical protein